MSTASVPYEHLGEALATDYFRIRAQFTDEQWVRSSTRVGSSTRRSCR